MTPFGAKVRALRQEKGIQLKKMAADLKVSSAYLSALEHGRRGRPGPGLVMQIADYFGLIWESVDELKHLAQLSHPRVPVDTGGLSPKATLLANLLAQHIHELDDATIERILAEMGFDEEA
ncbi:MAG: helix-turn-helix transcriptional regulator [Rhodospirillales bacterium]|jgi:transcriptional regulator with XRE-family HTH domain|nr:transcriptional regulator [Rhodospirillaceae bacterium]MDP6428343.1 helix-turn-helix transcriptional regulator [Rhodospirillales bacterium]MDP6642588.1 helix-turn-helix transcriptional regulator [Rhodospirillales bacterium]MDP6842345.1 helix-turn-helix transcriptional regulator [Rhodospirillales bacterium]|tara:strand:- start:1023 stop:1385 length:363 start_codon:yes stop_codon:yes gene_type:complete